MDYVDSWGQRFFSQSSCPMPTGQPLQCTAALVADMEQPVEISHIVIHWRPLDVSWRRNCSFGVFPSSTALTTIAWQLLFSLCVVLALCHCFSDCKVSLQSFDITPPKPVLSIIIIVVVGYNMLSNHLLAGLPPSQPFSTIPNITVFTSCSSFILRMCLNRFCFLCLMRSTNCAVFIHFLWQQCCGLPIVLYSIN